MDKELKFWLNSGNVLYIIIDNQPKYLPYVGISKIEWLTDDPRREGTRATIILQAQLPAASELFGLKNGANLEVLHYEYGDYSRYEVDNVIARLSNCGILNYWIDDFVTIFPDLSQVVTLFIRLNADFEILGSEDD